MASRETN